MTAPTNPLLTVLQLNNPLLMGLGLKVDPLSSPEKWQQVRRNQLIGGILMLVSSCFSRSFPLLGGGISKTLVSAFLRLQTLPTLLEKETWRQTILLSTAAFSTAVLGSALCLPTVALLPVATVTGGAFMISRIEGQSEKMKNMTQGAALVGSMAIASACIPMVVPGVLAISATLITTSLLFSHDNTHAAAAATAIVATALASTMLPGIPAPVTREAISLAISGTTLAAAPSLLNNFSWKVLCGGYGALAVTAALSPTLGLPALVTQIANNYWVMSLPCFSVLLDKKIRKLAIQSGEEFMKTCLDCLISYYK